MIERPDVNTLLAGPLGGWLEQQSDARAEAKRIAKRRRRIGYIAAAVALLAVGVFFQAWDDGFKLAFFLAAAGWGWGELAKRPVIQKLKGGINAAIATSLGMEYCAEIAPGDEFERATRFELLPSYDKATFEDCWSGPLEDRRFKLYEADLREWQGSGKNRRLVCVFQGSLITLGFTRRFLGITVVERQRNRRAFFGLGGEKTELEFDDVTLQLCDMVHPDFEDQFTVWSNDAVEARYLVHPEYIERLIAVEQAFAGQNVRALFCGGELLIVLESGNLFESGSIEQSDDRKLLERTIAQFASLVDLAARLNERPR